MQTCVKWKTYFFRSCEMFAKYSKGQHVGRCFGKGDAGDC